VSDDLKRKALAGANKRSSRLGSALVIGQVAMSVTALVAGGMLLHSLINLETMDTGFERHRVVAVDITGDSAGQTPGQVQAFYRRLLDASRALPGVEGAAISTFAPVSGRMLGVNVSVNGYESRPGEEPKAFLSVVTPGYFNTLGIPMLQGQDFTTQNTPQTPRVAIVNRSFARHYFPGEDAVGQHFLTFHVAQRAGEIGIRMALGAKSEDILRLVAAKGFRLAAAGLLLGSAVGLASERLLRGILFGVGIADPWTFAGITLLMAATAALACYVPARRAMRVDPLVALRSE
jgi:hypothetical protein